MTNEKKYPIRVGFSGDKQAAYLEKYLSSIIIGQPKAVQRLVEVMITLNSGLRDYRRPIGFAPTPAKRSRGHGKSYL